jgi:hypothetical protein
VQALTGGPRASLTAAAVSEALDLERGAHIRHGVTVVDRSSAETGETLRFTKAAVTWSYRPPDLTSGQQAAVAAVRRQATVETVGAVSIDLTTRRLRLWTEWQLADGSWARFNQGVFVIVNPGALSDDGKVLTRTLQLADKSHAWNLSTLSDPVTVASGTNVVQWIKTDMTAQFAETHFAITDEALTLGGVVTFEAGTSRLEVYSRLLAAIAYDQLTADEDGFPASTPLATLSGKGPERSFGPGAGKIVEAGSLEPLAPVLPNRLRFTARQGPASGGTVGNGIYVVDNQSTGPTSIDARGYVVEQRVEVEAYDQATLVKIGDAEKQRYFAGGGDKFTGSVALNPRASDRDVIAITLPRLSINGTTWQVTDWTYPLDPAISDPGAALMPIVAERRVP